MDSTEETADGKRRIAAAPWCARARNAALLYTAIAVGSIVGSVLRWLVGLWSQAVVGGEFPWATLFVNDSGSFVIGLFATLTGPDGRLFVGPRTRHFVMTGVCGGYTTFSMFSLETLRAMQRGALGEAATYVAVSITTWLAGVWAGDAIASRLNRLNLRRG